MKNFKIEKMKNRKIKTEELNKRKIETKTKIQET